MLMRAGTALMIMKTRQEANHDREEHLDRQLGGLFSVCRERFIRIPLDWMCKVTAIGTPCFCGWRSAVINSSHGPMQMTSVTVADIPPVEESPACSALGNPQSTQAQLLDISSARPKNSASASAAPTSSMGRLRQAPPGPASQ